MTTRTYSFLDNIIDNIDQGLRAIVGAMPPALRDSPAKTIKPSSLSDTEKKQITAMMRVNHTGEVCAQALYQGQALVARSKDVQEKLQQSALEENDHLNWCQERINELDGHVSYLNPLWHFGSLSLGIIAGIAGDKWSLGFLAETEKQVVKHIDGHLEKLPKQEQKSREILLQMREDEEKHAITALENGGVELPYMIKLSMQWASKIMTTVAYRV